MKRFGLCVVMAAVAAGLCLAPSESRAQAGRGSLGVDIGLTASPGLFAVGFDYDYQLSGSWSIGPTLHLGLPAGNDVVSTLLMIDFVDLHYTFNSGSALRPFLKSGLGLYRLDLKGNADSVTAFTVDFGGGLAVGLGSSIDLVFSYTSWLAFSDRFSFFRGNTLTTSEFLAGFRFHL
jgi:hypothetical protein